MATLFNVLQGSSKKTMFVGYHQIYCAVCNVVISISFTNTGKIILFRKSTCWPLVIGSGRSGQQYKTS